MRFRLNIQHTTYLNDSDQVLVSAPSGIVVALWSLISFRQVVCTSTCPEPRRRIISDWLLICKVHASQEHFLFYIKYKSLLRKCYARKNLDWFIKSSEVRKGVQSEDACCSVSRNSLLSLVPPHLPFHQPFFQAQTLLKVSYRAGGSVYAMQLWENRHFCVN